MLSAGHASAVVFGSLEARYESHSDDKCKSYFEQWVNLNQKDNSGLSWGFMGMNRSGGCGGQQLQHLFVSKKFAAAPLPFQITAGRFEHMDGGGFYTLDGFGLKWRLNEIELETYAGTPKRTELYPTPSNTSAKKDSPSTNHVAGFSLRTPIAGLAKRTDDRAFFKLGFRHAWGGEVAENRLDGTFTGIWQQPAFGLKSFHLDASFTLQPEDMARKIYDVQARAYFTRHNHIYLRTRKYEPPREPVTFLDRYYHNYNRGPQRIKAIGGNLRLAKTIDLSGHRRHISREFGKDGISTDIRGVFNSHKGWRIHAGIGKLDVGKEKKRTWQLALEYNLNSRLMLRLGRSYIKEDSALLVPKRVTAIELQLRWMITHSLHLSLQGEKIDVDYYGDRFGILEDIDADHISLRLIYQFPALKKADYR